MDQTLSSHRDGHHGGGGGGRHGGFQKRRYDGDNNRGGSSYSNRDREWSDNRRDHQGGGGGRFERRDNGGIKGDHGGNDRGGGRGGIPGTGGRGERERDDRRGPSRENHRSRGGSQQQHQQQIQGGGGYNRGPQARMPRGPPTAEDLERANTPIPQEQRRTLVLSDVPNHVKFFHIQQHFQNNWNNSFVQYSLMDRSTGTAHVRFKFVEDAKRVWEGGSEGLDGQGGGGDSWVNLGIKLKAIHFTNYMIDSRQTGNRTNNVDSRGGADPGGGGGGTFDRKRNWREDADRGGAGGYGTSSSRRHSHSIVHPHPPPPPSKMPRYSDQYDHNGPRNNAPPPPPSRPGKHNNSNPYYDPPQQQHYTPLAPSAAASNLKNNSPPNSSGHYNDQHYDPSHQPHLTPPTAASVHPSNPSTHHSNNTYHRSPMPMKQTVNDNKLTALEIQHQQQIDAKEQHQWEAFQNLESQWRDRRQVEYTRFIDAKNARLAQISTYEQKRDLLTKQESTLAKQLPLHKKMLSVLQAKSAPPAEQSKKMKEILKSQTRIMELKKEQKGLVEEIEKLKEVEMQVGGFRPSEKRPVYVGGSGGTVGAGRETIGNAAGSGDGMGSSPKKRSLDRRTTILRVGGFGQVKSDDGVEGKGGVTEDAIKQHFTTFGTVTSVSLEKQSAHDDTESLLALVNFANRVDAERAKSSNSKFNEVALVCTWHNTSSSSSTPNNNVGPGEMEGNHHPANAHDDDGNLNDELHDVGDAYSGGDQLEESAAPPPPDNEESVDYDYDEEEDYLVDYD